jgi:hypothetical protein
MAILTIGGKLYQIALLETDPVDSWYASLTPALSFLIAAKIMIRNRTANVPRYGTH